jgi:hypothetical protein
MEWIFGPSSTVVENIGVPQFGQNDCCRLVPLSAVFRYIFNSPDRSLNEPCREGTTLRNAEPDRVWQSVQWQIPVISGSASAS